MPKQFIPVLGERSPYQETPARVSGAPQFASPIVITSSDFRFLAAEQARALGVKPNIVLEPVRRDSGPAVAVATTLVLTKSPETVVLVLAADHHMPDRDAFCKACVDALPCARCRESCCPEQ